MGARWLLKLVTSVRGPKGGHLLAEKPENISLGQVVRLFEGQSDLVESIGRSLVAIPARCQNSRGSEPGNKASSF